MSSTDPTAPQLDVFRIIPCEGWVVRKRLDASRELVRHPDGSERIVHYIHLPDRRTD